MNNTEIEMILQELLKEVQDVRSGMSQLSRPSPDNDSIVSKQLDAIFKGLDIINGNLKAMGQVQKAETTRIHDAALFRLEEKLKEFKQFQWQPPPRQVVTHEHSFKNWQWLAVLFLFIAMTVVLGWYAMDNYYESKDLKVKYGFIRKEMPGHIRQLDSAYAANPQWVKGYELKISQKKRLAHKRKR